MKRLLALIRDTWNRYSDDHGDLLAAAVAFYSLLSIAPLTVIAITVAGLVFERAHVREGLFRGVADASNADVAGVLMKLLDSAEKSGGRVAAVFALLMLAWAASRLFLELQEALNLMWGVRVTAAKNTRESIRRTAVKRLTSFAMVLGSGTTLLALLVLQTLMASTTGVIKRFVHAEELRDAFGIVQQVSVSFVLLAVICAVIYRVLPDARIRWRDVWVGSAITALLVLIGTALLGLYLTRIAPAWLQGAVGSIAVFMIWTYYLAQVFLIGAAFTRVWACRSGDPITPEPHAEVRPELRERERLAAGALSHSTRQSSAQ
jgi:membrane protein